MAATSKLQETNRTMATTTWFAGVGLFLLEMSASVHYLQAGLEAHTPNLLSLLPMFAMLTVRVASQVVENFNGIEYALRLLPLAMLPFALMLAGVIFERRSAR
jgi:hypothetical protein